MAKALWGIAQTHQEHYMLVLPLPNYEPSKVSVGMGEQEIITFYSDDGQKGSGTEILNKIPLRQKADKDFISQNLYSFFRGSYLCILLPKKGW